MSAAELVFLIFAFLAMAGAVLVLLGESTRHVFRGFALTGGALAGLFVLLSAPVVAALEVLAVAVVLVAVGPAAQLLSAQSSRKPGRLVHAVGGLGLGVLVFVLLGTLARQYVSYGAELDEDPGFGSHGRLASELFGRHVLSLEILALILLTAVIAVVLATRRQTAPSVGDADSL